MKIAFNTANLVGRVTGYRFKLSNWMDQHHATVKATDEKEWKAICKEIVATGFKAVEIWEAHASPEVLTEDKARIWKTILADYGLTPIAYAGGMRAETARICQWLGIPHVDGGIGNVPANVLGTLCQSTGIGANHENHPEKSVAEIKAKVNGGGKWVGVAVDTGWLGTQGVDAPTAIRGLGPLVRHVHLKDVKHAGGHDTCPLGEGCVKVAEVITALKEIGYAGDYSWEDEPEDRNPFEIAVAMREWIEARVGA
jgi:sugar phosphate isomerase/epimerase